MFLVDPTVSDDEISGIQERLSELAASRGARVKELRPWARRRLAYDIKGRRDGVYVLAQLQATPEVIKEIERLLSVNETVLRHLTVRLDEH
jgi:small subunit ribosomal protein S6